MITKLEVGKCYRFANPSISFIFKVLSKYPNSKEYDCKPIREVYGCEGAIDFHISFNEDYYKNIFYVKSLNGED